MNESWERGGAGSRSDDERENLDPLGFSDDYAYTEASAGDPGPSEGLSDPDEEDYRATLFKPEPDPGLVRSLLSYLYVGSLLTFSSVVFFAIGYGWPFLQDHIDQLPGLEIVNDYRPNLGSQLLDYQGEPVAEFFGKRDRKEKRLRLVRYEDIPTHFIQALVATEDQQFWRHTGLNPVRIASAALHNFRTGSRHGGSTLTQQLAKDLFTNWAPTLKRKMVEALYATKMEKELTKEEILTVFLNQVDFGHGTRGLLSASEHYFGKPPRELNLAESATLVGLLKANSRYSPISNREKSKDRRRVVLRLMKECKYIAEEEYEAAAEEELVLKSKSSRGVPQLDKYPYWTSFVRDKLLIGPTAFESLPLTSDFAQIDEAALYTNGFKIVTTLDPTLQEWGEEALRHALVEQERIRRKNGLPDTSKYGVSSSIRPKAKLVGEITGFEEPGWLTVKLLEVAGKPIVAVPHPGRKDWRERFGVLSPPYKVPVRAFERNGAGISPEEQDLIDRGLVTNQAFRFELENPYDDQHAEGALVCLEVGTGRILAWVGGYDWHLELPASRRNRVVEPVQPGSSFKPIIYAAAFEKGYTPATRVSNAPFVRYDNGVPWAPKNYYADMIGGVYPVRKIIIKSLNIPTVRVFESIVGGAYVHEPFYGKPTLEIAKRLGIRSLVPKNLSIALGTAEITPLEMATAYSVFANEGLLVEPYAIESIASRDGERVYSHVPRGNENAYSPLNSFLMTNILTGVVREPAGTGYRLVSQRNFPYPIAGKTGTTNEFFDAWFVGYSKNLVTVVWIGHDRWTSLGSKRSGGRVALPPWLDFMEKAIPHHFETRQGVSKETLEAANQASSLAASPLDFARPNTGLQRVEVCTWSNLKPNAWCDKTTTIWVREGEEPRGVCRDHGLPYAQAPFLSRSERFPSQAPSFDPSRPRQIRRLRPVGVGTESPTQQGPQMRIENIRDVDFNQPAPVYDLDPSVQPAVPRPLPKRESRG